MDDNLRTSMLRCGEDLQVSHFKWTMILLETIVVHDAVRISGVTIDEARQLPQGAKRKGAPPNSIKIIIIIIIIIKFSFIRTRTIPSVTDAGGIYKK